MNSGLVVSVPAFRLPVLGSYLGPGPLNSAVLEAAGCKKNSHGSGIYRTVCAGLLFWLKGYSVSLYKEKVTG